MGSLRTALVLIRQRVFLTEDSPNLGLHQLERLAIRQAADLPADPSSLTSDPSPVVPTHITLCA